MRETVTWLVIVAYAALAAGLPLPAGAVVASPRHLAAAAKAGLLAAKDRSRPFPCMDSPCGCATAEQCFRECCCHSVSERLDWARRNGLEAELLAVLEGRQGTAVAEPGRQDGGKPAAGGCCASRGADRNPSCCATAVSVAAPSGDDPCEDACHVAVAADDAPPPRDVPRRKSVTLRALLACQGLVAEWVSLGGTLPPLRVETGAIVVPGGWVALHDALALSPTRAPESPPPESV